MSYPNGSLMGQTTPSYSPAEFPTTRPPELEPDLPGSPAYRPEVQPKPPKTPGTPKTPDAPNTVPGRPDAPSTLPDRPEEPHTNPEIDPDIPEHPGPPLSDPESPRGQSWTTMALLTILIKKAANIDWRLK
jgi:hypothetical protein